MFLFSRETLSSSEGASPVRVEGTLGARMALALAVLALPLASAGCTQVSCFEWTEAEGVCPSQDEAAIFFQEPTCGWSDVETVDSEPEFDDNACCYEVTKRGENDFFTCDTTGVSVGVGGSVGAGGAGGVGGIGTGGAGGFAGAGGSAGAGGAPECIRCDAAIAGEDPSLLCMGTSKDLFDTYMECMCDNIDACAEECADNYCMAPQNKTMVCAECEVDTINGCGTPLSACLNEP